MPSFVKSMVDTQHGLIDRRIFFEQDIYQQELEQVFGRSWLFIGHESQVSNNNDFTATYMGEDPVLLTRDSKGRLHAFLNMCRHRGNRICRTDHGNAPSFMCTYHGWTFATDGKLVGVPGYKEAYFEELDRSQWGLVETGQIDSHKGLIFATWDKSAPTLKDYLGDMAFYLDLHADRQDGGSELIGGVLKWVMGCNWKFPADNFIGDDYHTRVNHGSVAMVRGGGVGGARSYASTPGSFAMYTDSGHGVTNFGGGPVGKASFSNMVSESMKRYYEEQLLELEQRLGKTRGKYPRMKTGSVFPNFSIHSANQLRLYNPKGPTNTEVWIYCIVDKTMPQDVKEACRKNLMDLFGPAGIQEQDDENNWIQCTQSGRSPHARKYPVNQQMGIGREKTSHEEFPGRAAPALTESNQRAFYERWSQMMSAANWAQLPR